MKLQQIAAIAVMAAGIAACEPAAHPAATPATSPSSAPATAWPQPVKQVNASRARNVRLGAKYENIVSYVEFRKQLHLDGWTSVPDLNCMENVVGASHEDICRRSPDLRSCDLCTKLPELSSCSADGYCSMKFKKDEAILIVTTYGDTRDIDEPGKWGLDVTGWELEN